MFGSEKKLHEESIPSASKDPFKVPGPPAPKRKKKVPPTNDANAKPKRTKLEEEYEEFLKKGKDWVGWWRFECPEEEEEFERRLPKAYQQFYAAWDHEAQPRFEDKWEVENKVYEEILANRMNN